jgi:hypothetical protein
MGYRLPGLRIDNVRDTFAVEFIVVAIAAGGADAVTIDIDNRLNGVFRSVGFWIATRQGLPSPFIPRLTSAPPTDTR